MRIALTLPSWLLPAWLGLVPLAAAAQAPVQLQTRLVGSGFDRPVFVTAPPSDSARVFVVEQRSGRIKILNPSTQHVEPEPFLRVTNLTAGSEQGLLGLAFHPDYSSNGFFYVNYTTTGGGNAGHSEIARFQAQGDPRTANRADPASKAVLLTYSQPEANHNGGWVGFGKDRFLYISTGDGGGGDDQHGSIGNGQNLNSLLGKMLRIDVDQAAPYAIPDGNPFQGMTGARAEIWAFGLRNPWRCSVDRLTGDLWIGDVGQGAREEIDFLPAGRGGLNFGWRPREGLIQNTSYRSETPVTAATDPVHDYNRSLGFCVTGGYVYRGPAIPALHGTYLFADYGTSRFWSFRYDGTNKLDLLERTAELNSGTPKPIGNISSFGEDGSGELYICDLDDGEIYQVTSTTPPLQLTGASVDGDQFQFQFLAAPTTAYVVESREALDQSAWLVLTNISSSTAGSEVRVTDSVGTTRRFYRVRQTAP